MNELTDEQREEMKQSFNEMDLDKNGVISIDEIDILLLKIGLEVPQELLEPVIAEIDTDGDGTINFDEFVSFMNSLRQELFNNLQDTFKRIDVDADGYLNAEEIKTMFESLGEEVSMEEVQQMIIEADVDDNNKISFEEFVSIMR